MKVPTSVAIELDLRQWLDRLAAREDLSRSDLVNTLLRRGMAAHEAPLFPRPEATQANGAAV